MKWHVMHLIGEKKMKFSGDNLINYPVPFLFTFFMVGVDKGFLFLLGLTIYLHDLINVEFLSV